MNGFVPAFPVQHSTPTVHPVVAALAFAVKVLGWLLLAAVCVLVLMVVVAVRAFVPILRASSSSNHRRW
ncbi:hypothetical protein [Kitasatospora sp. NPDC001527]|uniref:hypothetical protein n=1 Tax=Kitasatospora sp. NPDC001527 TaxID=3154519 RepID=UPI00333096F3